MLKHALWTSYGSNFWSSPDCEQSSYELHPAKDACLLLWLLGFLSNICILLILYCTSRILAGFNCSLFAYGQTGAGKSYSMVGYGNNKLVHVVSKRKLSLMCLVSFFMSINLLFIGLPCFELL